MIHALPLSKTGPSNTSFTSSFLSYLFESTASKERKNREGRKIIIHDEKVNESILQRNPAARHPSIEESDMRVWFGGGARTGVAGVSVAKRARGRL